jgi:hypothetical protein
MRSEFIEAARPSRFTEAMRRTLRNRLPVICACLLAAICPAQAHAQTDAAWGPEQLMMQLGQLRHGKARFVERKYMKVLQSPLELTGTLTYEAPGRLVKQTLQPRPETMTIEGDRLTIERRGRERTLRLQDYPSLWAFVESVRSTLNGNLAGLQQFYDLRLEGDQEHWTLALTPKDPKMRALVDSIRIGGQGGHVDTVEVREAKGDRSVMTIVEDPP